MNAGTESHEINALAFYNRIMEDVKIDERRGAWMLPARRNEITGHHICLRLARAAKDIHKKGSSNA